MPRATPAWFVLSAVSCLLIVRFAVLDGYDALLRPSLSAIGHSHHSRRLAASAAAANASSAPSSNSSASVAAPSASASASAAAAPLVVVAMVPAALLLPPDALDAAAELTDAVFRYHPARDHLLTRCLVAALCGYWSIGLLSRCSARSRCSLPTAPPFSLPPAFPRSPSLSPALPSFLPLPASAPSAPAADCPNAQPQSP